MNLQLEHHLILIKQGPRGKPGDGGPQGIQGGPVSP